MTNDAEPQDEEVRWSLIARAAVGDRSAQSLFSRSFLPIVRAFLETRWRGTRLIGDVDDAVQEVFVECLRDNGVLSRADSDRGDPRGLLFGVTRNVAARFEERARKRHSRDQDLGSEIGAIRAREPSLSMMFDREWARTIMRLAGDRMRADAECGNPGARLRVEILRMRFAEGLPIREIAVQLEIHPDAVNRAYAKARDEFRACLRTVIAEHAVRSEVDLNQEVLRVLDLLG